VRSPKFKSKSAIPTGFHRQKNCHDVISNANLKDVLSDDGETIQVQSHSGRFEKGSTRDESE
jgi:hypothetical protein